MNHFIENLDLHAKGGWLPDTFGILLLLIVLFMRKRISWREIFFVWATLGFLAWMTDTLVAVQLDLFDLGDPQKRGIGEVLNYSVIPACLAIIFLNYFKLENKWLFAIAFTVISVLYEWGLVKIGNMTLHGWHTWWSIPVYLFLFGLFIPWVFRLLRKEHTDSNGRSREYTLNLFKEKVR